jgi:NAD(P)-dependent dehydrogenase (short-subunit alcohol dehydrogenase family)
VNSSILITGAGRGLGLYLVHRYLEAGFVVFAGTRKPAANLVKLRESSPDRLFEISLDVTSRQSLATAATEVAKRVTAVDILMNNAAILPEAGRGSLEELAVDVGLQVFDVNALGPLRTTQAFLPLVEKSQRRLIVNISSEAGSIGDCWRKDEFLYCMSKSALNMQTAILKNLLSPRGIELLAIHPGWLRTDMGGPNADLDPREAAEGIFELTTRAKQSGLATYIDHRGKPMRW